jgi:hypothetical protein
MRARFNAAELAAVVAKTLSSIDVRTTSVLVEGRWQNVMTVIRLLCDSTVEASANGEEIWGKHGPVHSDEFRIDNKRVAFYGMGSTVDGVRRRTYSIDWGTVEIYRRGRIG